MRDWTRSSLGQLIELQRGHDLPIQNRATGNIPVISSSGIAGFHNVARYEGPGVTIGRSGVIGGAIYVTGDYWPLNTCLFVRDFRGRDPRWVFNLLKSIDFTGFNSGSAQPSLNRNYLANIPVLVPPLAEQHAIAEVLGALDDKIAANTKLAVTIEALGAAKIRALGINAEPENGAVTLDTLFDFNPRRSPSSDMVTLIDMQALPTSEPLIDTWSDGPKRGGTRFMNGDTLLARITPCLENRKTGFVDFLDDGQVGIGSTEFIVMRSRAGLPLGLSYFVATSSRFRDFAIQNMVGTSGRQRVAAADIARFEFNPIDARNLVEFGTWADENLRLLGALRNENHTLNAIRDALLPQLMSGKLRVKDAADLVSSVS
jgi:type I restriction enzyme, S subunit